MIKYYNEFKDERGYVHSIDEITVDYFVKDFNLDKVIQDICLLCAMSSFKMGDNTWDAAKQMKRDLVPQSRYDWFTARIWTGGYLFSVGQWVQFDKVNRDWTKLPILRLKVNPNKHANIPLWEAFKKYVSDNCDEGYLVKYDYAVDVSLPPSSVENIGSRKEPGLLKGTRYWGQRGRHGRIKIYDKQEEQKLESPLTRIEYTFKSSETRTFDNIVVVDYGEKRKDYDSLSSQLQTYINMIIEIENLGGDKQKYLKDMNYRTYKKIEPFVIGRSEKLINDETIVDVLIDNLSRELMIKYKGQKVNVVKTEYGIKPFVDDEGFVIVDEDNDFIPFN